MIKGKSKKANRSGRYKKGKRGTIYNKYGLKFTKKEQEEILNLVKEVNKIKKDLDKQFPKLDDVYQNLGMENPLSIMRRSKSFHQFTNKGLLKAWKKQAKEIIRNPKKYISKKQKIFQENYIKSIINNYSLFSSDYIEDVIDYLPESVKDLLIKVLNDTPEEFYSKYESGEYPEINDNYIPQQEYETLVKEVYSIYPEDDIEDKDNELIELYNTRFNITKDSSE